MTTARRAVCGNRPRALCCCYRHPHLSGHVRPPRSVRPSPQGREDFSSTTQKAMCRPPQIRHAALAGKVVQGQRSNAMVSADADVSTNSPTMTFLFTEFANCTTYHLRVRHGTVQPLRG